MKQEIDKAIKEAMVAKQKNKLVALRAIKAEFIVFEKTGKKLTDKNCVSILRKMVKKGVDSANQFYKAGRDELGDKEAYEVEIYQSFLPVEMSDKELKNFVDDLIEKLEATSMDDMGKVMAYTKTVDVNATPARISKAVKKALS